MFVNEILGLRPRPPILPTPASAPSFPSLAALQNWAETQGVELDVHLAIDRIELHDIGRVVGPKGAGAVVMRALCQFADEQHKPVALEALDDKPERIRYFMRFGFAPSRGREIDNAGMIMMRPVSPIPTRDLDKR